MNFPRNKVLVKKLKTSKKDLDTPLSLHTPRGRKEKRDEINLDKSAQEEEE